MAVAAALGTVGGMFFVMWASASAGAGFIAAFPWALIAALWWLERLALPSRMAFALTGGFLLDSFLPGPFGVHIAIFILLAFVVEFLHAVFSGRESAFARGAALFLLILFWFMMMPLAHRMLAN